MSRWFRSIARVVAVAGVAAAACLSLLGCRTDSGSSLISDVGQVRYPLDSYRFSAKEQDLIDRATYDVTNRCVRRFGLTLPARGPARDLTPRDRYGLVDERHAKVWAYSLDMPSKRAQPWFVAIAPRSRLFNVVTGSASTPPVKNLPVGGCNGEALTLLYEGLAVDRDPVQALDREAWNQSMKEKLVVNATMRWHRCMREAGLAYADPVGAPYGYWGEKRMAAFAALPSDAKKDGVSPPPEEVEAALTDVRCKHTSRLLDTWIAADIETQRHLIDREHASLTAHRRTLDAQLARARTLSGSS